MDPSDRAVKGGLLIPTWGSCKKKLACITRVDM